VFRPIAILLLLAGAAMPAYDLPAAAPTQPASAKISGEFKVAVRRLTESQYRHTDLTLANQPGTLGAVCTLVGEQQANIDNLGVTLRKPDFFLMSVDLEVRDVKHLSDILTALRAQSFVNQVDRAITPPERAAAETAGEQPRLPLGSSPAPHH
jgi:hypothetical protein